MSEEVCNLMRQDAFRILADAYLRLAITDFNIELERLSLVLTLGPITNPDDERVIRLKEVQRLQRVAEEALIHGRKAMENLCNAYRSTCGSAAVHVTLPSLHVRPAPTSASLSPSPDTTAPAEHTQRLPPFRYLPPHPQGEYEPDSPDLFEPE